MSTSRVAASITLGGHQDVRVRVIPGCDGGQVVAVRIGTLLIYLEDNQALTELIEAAAAAHNAGNHVFGSDNPEARSRRTRPGRPCPQPQDRPRVIHRAGGAAHTTGDATTTLRPMTHHTPRPSRAHHCQHLDPAHPAPHQLHGSPAHDLGDETHWLDTQAEYDRWLILYGDPARQSSKVQHADLDADA